MKQQKRLLEYKEKQNALNKSWLEDWWLEAAYLAYRAPSPTNSNFLFLFDTGIIIFLIILLFIIIILTLLFKNNE